MADDGAVSAAYRLAATGLAAAAVVALAGCTGSDADLPGARTPQFRVVDPGPSGVFAVGDRVAAPEIAGKTLEGEPLDVASMRGKVVVVNFWGSWCPPCRAEADNLAAVARRHKASGVEFVGVAIKDEIPSALAFQRTKRTPYPSLFDQAGIVLTRFRALAPQSPPTTLLLDRKGRVAGRFIGGVTETELDGPVQALAKEPA